MKANDFPVALVTGANGGIGRILCTTLIQSGYRVILSFRKSDRSLAFYNQMLQEYGRERVESLEMDLSSVTSIKKATQYLLQKETRLDVLINNAGMLGNKRENTNEGYEMHNMVNCLGPTLFTYMLRPLLKPGSRVVTTVSVVLYYGSIPDFFPYPPIRYNRFRQYACSKLALTLLCLRLSELWEKDGITINMVDPGVVDTPIINIHKWIDPLADVLFRPLIRTPEQGAATSLYLATHADLEGVTGGIYKDMTVRNLPERVRSYPQAENVWRFFLYLHSKQ